VRSCPAVRLAAGLSVGVLALTLAACGQGDPDDAGADALTGARPASADQVGSEVTAEEDDHSVTLSERSLAAGTHTFVVRNTGSAPHSLTIEGPGGVDSTSDTVQRGRSTTLTVTLSPGEYEVFCPIGDDRAMGMVTTLTVG
jgi:plastocyanin